VSKRKASENQHHRRERVQWLVWEVRSSHNLAWQNGPKVRLLSVSGLTTCLGNLPGQGTRIWQGIKDVTSFVWDVWYCVPRVLEETVPPLIIVLIRNDGWVLPLVLIEIKVWNKGAC
jgi:hypothetical protein